MPSTVAVVTCTSYDPDECLAALTRALDLLGNTPVFGQEGETVVLKPNVLFGAHPDKAVTTHPSVFRAVALRAREEGVQAQYGDSPAVLTPRYNLRRSGLTAVAEETGLVLTDMQTAVRVDHPGALLAHALVLAQGIVEADGVVSVAKLKTHGLTRFTGAVKNLYGCVPGISKGQYHAQYPNPYDFCRLLVDIATRVGPRLSVVDAVTAMQGNGPGGGEPRYVGCLIVSRDPVAADATACRLVNLPPECVPTCTFGEEAGLGVWREEDIRIVGDSLSDLRVMDFDVVRAPPVHLTGGRVRAAIKSMLVPRPRVVRRACIRCGRCVEVCPTSPKSVDFGPKGTARPPRHRYSSCIRCFCCSEVCPEKAMVIHRPLLGRLMPIMSFLSLLLTNRALRKARRT